ncbi:MAG: hypothetical protein FWD66_04860 [Paludibacter sp.]|nr:hypothetical protein [Paludibacter sp.]
MNLFLKKLFGQLQSTAHYEQEEKDTLAAMHRYDEIEKSAELAEYHKLFHIIKSATFQENKKVMLNRRYRDTEESRNCRKLEKLQKNASIRKYYDTVENEPLQLFLSFKQSPEYELLGNPKHVKKSQELKYFKKFERSKEYKNYVRFHNSYVIKELENLQEKVDSSEFQRANNFWKNPKRWETTPEYTQEQRFYSLAKNPDIEFFNNETPERFKKYRERTLTFSQEFDTKTLAVFWQPGFNYASQQLIGNHSFANEKSANNNGKNAVVENSILKILTRSECTKAPAWDVEKGFIEKDFDYTSDIITTAESFRQECGMFQAKIRCTGKIHHAFWLGADGKLPHINIFHFNGKKITVGNARKEKMDGTVIKGISRLSPFVYTLIWKKNELVWYINNLEVFSIYNNIPKEELYMAFNSFISAKQKGSIGSLEVDWVRVFQI